MNNKNLTFLFAFIFIVSFVFSFAGVALGAQGDRGSLAVDCKGASYSGNGATLPGTSEKKCDFLDFVALVNKLISFLLYISFTIVIFALIYTGFKLLTSGGDPGPLKEAKTMFGKVLIGFFLIFAGWIIVQFVVKGFGLQDGVSFLAI